MTDNCYGVPVPPVPERPIDLNQPAYVLVDGRWVELSEVFSRYASPVISLQTIVIPVATVPPVNSTMTQLQSTIEITPRSENSRLLLRGYLSFRVESPTGAFFSATTGFTRQTSTNIWDNAIFNTRSAIEQVPVIPSSHRGYTSAAFQLDLGPSDVRTDDGKWAVAAWATCGGGVIYKAETDLQVTVMEYLPPATP